VQETFARQFFPEIEPIGYERAVLDSLGKLDPREVEPIWRQVSGSMRSLKHAGFCILQRQASLEVEAGTTRETLRKLFTPGSKAEEISEVTRSTSSGNEQIWLIRSKRRLPGLLWWEWRVESRGAGSRVSQAILFAPKGVPGFWGWYLLGPWLRFWQWIEFRKLTKWAVRLAKQKG
jgi:hypothetical protein